MRSPSIRPSAAARLTPSTPPRLPISSNDASPAKLREAIDCCVAAINDRQQVKLEILERFSNLLTRAEATRRQLTVGRERARSEIEAAVSSVNRVLGLLDLPAQLDLHSKKGEDATPAEVAARPTGTPLDAGAVGRANRHISALHTELRNATRALDLAKSQLSHLRGQLRQIRHEKTQLTRQVATLSEEQRLSSAEKRFAARQADQLVHYLLRFRDEQFKTILQFFSREHNAAAYASNAYYDARRSFTMLLLEAIVADPAISDDLRQHALRIVELFDPIYYLARYPDIGLAGLNPLLHYVKQGWREQRRPSLLFDPEYYGGYTGKAQDPLLHYMEAGSGKPHPLFDSDFYRHRYMDVAQSGLNPLVHYQLIGARERRQPSLLFDPDYFLAQYALPINCEDPLSEYLTQGDSWAEGHPLFSASYFAAQAEVVEFLEAPLVTYVKHRELWNRAPHPLFDPIRLGEIPGDRSPLEYFIEAGTRTDIDVHALFDASLYRYQVEEERGEKLTEPPLVHYLKSGWRDKSLLPNVIFDPATYLARNGADGETPELVHYVLEGDRAGYWVHPMFCAAIYNRARDDGAPVTALEHFFSASPAGAKPSHPHMDRPLDHYPIEFLKRVVEQAQEFDLKFYWACYPDIRALNAEEAIAHYYNHGHREQRAGTARQLLRSAGLRIRDVPLGFFVEDYCRLNVGLDHLGQEFYPNFLHYLAHGRNERRWIGRWQFHLDALSNVIRSSPNTVRALDREAAQVDVGLLIHIFYADLWPELSAFAANFDAVSRDVFINLVDSAWTPRLHSELRELCPEAFVQLSNDNGRDIGGFFRLLDNVDFERYPLFALMHSKKSPHLAPERGEYWRRSLLTAFAGTRDTVRDCVRLFHEDQSVGLIGCADYRDSNLGDNDAAYKALLDRLNIEERHRELDYLSGTMFLIRSNILKRLYDDLRGMEWEYGGNEDIEFHRDGQIAHAVERVIGCLVRQMGYRIVWRPLTEVLR